jgi:cellulose synthase/poly-beta-1,6-N-acetylglucosamine synthase-like glycosyltransferase
MPPDIPLVSVVVCTYRRADDLVRLLACLDGQTWPCAEVVVVDGSGEDASIRRALAERARSATPKYPLHVLTAPEGLTRQRNAALAAARGDLICFLDDDVTVGPDFLTRAVSVFAGAEAADVGGITGHDRRHHGRPVAMQWRLQRWLGVIPSLVPGAVDEIGRRVPLDFLGIGGPPARVGWLPGFCMIYRRGAVAGRRFDEELPTYAGEDKEFSMAVGTQWRLLYCPELVLEHHRSPAARAEFARRIYDVAFGMGRGFARRRLSPLGRLRAARYVLGELVLLTLGMLRRPSGVQLRAIGAMVRGTRDGVQSARTHRSVPAAPELAGGHGGGSR